MKNARLFDGVDDSGQPFFRADHPLIEDASQRHQIVGFLRGGTIIFGTNGRDLDRLEPSKGRVVPLTYHTDGEWIWSGGLSYYVDAYGIAPQADFLDHMRQRSYVADVPDANTSVEALNELEASWAR